MIKEAAVFFTPLYNRSIELLIAPTQNFEMIWFVVPLIIITLLMTFYFARYTYEELGWNTAVGNSLVLIFISIDLLRYLFNLSDPSSFQNYLIHWTETMVVLGVAIEGILLLYTNFLHFLPKRVAFFISSPLPVNLTAYVVMAIVYTEVPIEWITLWAALAIFLVLFTTLSLLKHLLHWQIERIHEVQKEEEKEAKIKKKIEEEVERSENKKKKVKLKK
ncbi:MAG: hypothetical protein Q8R00_04275 [Candidatus Nanoarchaeia archaeon]|nr:hypothetical protein [Candidatus Nanoarchaeia archaeon]